MDKVQFRTLIEDVLRPIGLNSNAAVSLLMGTAAAESALGKYWYQVGGGPALGPFQMEPGTEADHWQNFIAFNRKIKAVMAEMGYFGPDPDRLQYDLKYQIIMARIHYLRVKEALPEAEDVQGLARYWKDHYNTRLGSGTVEGFITKWNRYVA
ncbi:MAG: hypothetical protein WC114_11765 [Smithellaceae bacterium]